MILSFNTFDRAFDDDDFVATKQKDSLIFRRAWKGGAKILQDDTFVQYVLHLARFQLLDTAKIGQS